jgi:hypothetical protein
MLLKARRLSTPTLSSIRWNVDVIISHPYGTALKYMVQKATITLCVYNHYDCRSLLQQSQLEFN